MRGLLLRDALVLLRKASAIRIVGLVIAGILFTFAMRLAGSATLGVVLPLVGTGMVSILAAEDEKANWQKFVRASPASAWDVACARYLVCWAILLAVCVYATLLNLVCFLLFHEQPLYVYLVVSAIGALVAYLNALLIVPSCFSHGTSGASLVGTVFLFLAGGLAWLVRQVDITGMVTSIASIPMYAYVLGGLALVILATALSMAVSVHVCKNKTIY